MNLVPASQTYKTWPKIRENQTVAEKRISTLCHLKVKIWILSISNSQRVLFVSQVSFKEYLRNFMSSNIQV